MNDGAVCPNCGAVMRRVDGDVAVCEWDCSNCERSWASVHLDTAIRYRKHTDAEDNPLALLKQIVDSLRE